MRGAYGQGMRHLALLFALVVACSSAPALTRCTPGASVQCVCPGVGTGAQVCEADGESYGACVCGVDGGAAADAVTAPRDVVAARDAGARGGPPRPADPRCADRLTARDWCGSDEAGRCVDRQTDPMNCGGCGARCTGAISECFDGTCFLPLDAGAPDVTP